MTDYTFEMNEPWTFLNKRGNPVAGRRLTYEYKDGTIFTVDVTMAEVKDKAIVEAKLQEQIDAHEALKA